MSDSISSKLKERLITGFKLEKKKSTHVKTAGKLLSEFFIEKYSNDSLNDYKEFMKQLSEIDDFFLWQSYSEALNKGLLKKYSEEEILKIEKEIAEELLISKEPEEKILNDFLGKINFKGLDLSLTGHFFRTENRLILIPWRASQITLGRVMGSRMRDVKVVRRRRRMALAIIQNIKSEVESLAYSYPITYPYNIQKILPFSIMFSMNYEYKHNDKDKVFHLVSTLSLIKYKNEVKDEFMKRQETFYTNMREAFSLIPNTACPNCYNVQDKKLETCEKCGIKLKNRI
ncbi:MAG: hypothetical protein ACFE9N_11860 [Promethearchaeota archaeon]